MESTELRNGIIKSIEDYFHDNDWNYKFNEESNIFNTGMNISNKLKSIDYYILVKERGFLTVASIEIKADDDCKLSVAEFLTRANCGLTDGCFEMDYDNGAIRYRMYHDCIDGIPSTDAVRKAIIICAEMIKRYGNALLSVMFGMQTPKEAIESAEKKPE